MYFTCTCVLWWSGDRNIECSYCVFCCVPSGLVDTAVKTAETGYMQRRLVKVHCSLYIMNIYIYIVTTIYIGTVRPYQRMAIQLTWASLLSWKINKELLGWDSNPWHTAYEADPLPLSYRGSSAELVPPCDARRREKVGSLYSAVYGLLAVFSRAYPQFLSLAPQNIIALAIVLVIIDLNQEIYHFIICSV